MKLKSLLKELPARLLASLVVKGSKEIEITGLSAHSRYIAPGHLFVAKQGAAYDGHLYILDALQAGASAILTDLYDPSCNQVTQLIHPDVAKVEPLLALGCYGHPSDELFMVGVTGTNGKTTTTCCIHQLFKRFGLPTGLIGTLGYEVGSTHYEAPRTTPDVCTTHKLLRDMVRHGCKAAVMEVTSHALTQGRVTGVDFDVALFTNLTQDHLDYHGTMEHYAQAKRKLFQSLTTKKGSGKAIAILNADSPWCTFMQEGMEAHLLTYGIEKCADLTADSLLLTPQGSHCIVHYKGEQCPLFVPLPGRFNLYNLLGSLAVCLVRNISLQAACEAICHIQPIPGRLEQIPNALNKWIYVDYGHTDDALRQTLSSLRELTTGRIIHLFGCGGDRDRDKRPKMAAVSEELADYTIITNDNPRSEQGIDIAKAIQSGFSPNARYHIELDRKQAIQEALKMARKEDVVLLSGKGHETRQVFAHQTIDFDDRQVARTLCEEMAMTTETPCL